MLRELAAGGDVDAQITTARILEHCSGVDPDGADRRASACGAVPNQPATEIRALYLDAAGQGDPRAALALAARAAPGSEERAAWLQAALADGELTAALALARDALDRPQPDVREAHAWLTFAATDGVTGARFELARLEAELGPTQLQQARASAIPARPAPTNASSSIAAMANAVVAEDERGRASLSITSTH